MQFAINHRQTSSLIREVFRQFPTNERKFIESEIAAVTESELTTAVRPFMFGGKIIHELYFDHSKLMLFSKQEKIGAIASAFIISLLSGRGGAPLSDQALRTHAEQIVRYVKRVNYGNEISAFLTRFRILENEWRKNLVTD